MQILRTGKTNTCRQNRLKATFIYVHCNKEGVELLWDSKLHDPLLLITGQKKEIKLQFPRECLPV